MLNLILILVPLALLLLAVLLGFKRNFCQSGLRLVCTLVAAVLAAWIVGANDVFVNYHLSKFLMTYLPYEVGKYFYTFPYFGDLTQIVVHLVMPLVFFVIFLVLYSLFSLVYLVAAKFLSEENMRATGAEGNAALLLRSGSILCSVLSCVIAMAMVLTPVSYVSAFVEDITDDLSQEQLDFFGDGVGMSRDIALEIQENPVHAMLQGVNSLVTRPYRTIDTQTGERVVISQPISAAIQTTCSIRFMKDGSTAQSLRLMAKQIDSSPYLNKVLTQMTNDMFDHWGRGENFLGIEPIEIISPSITQMIYSAIPECEDISEVLEMLAGFVELGGYLGLN